MPSPGSRSNSRLIFASPRPRSALRLDMAGTRTGIRPGARRQRASQADAADRRRGWQPLPRLRLWTNYPLGLFRVWSWLHPDQPVLVWPRAEIAGPPPQAPADDAPQTRRAPGRRTGGLARLPRQRSAAPDRVEGQRAPRQACWCKDSEQPQRRGAMVLDCARCADSDHEARIARLARWLGEAQAQRRITACGCPAAIWPGQRAAALRAAA